MKPLAASLLEALDYDSSDDSDFKVGDASGKYFLYPQSSISLFLPSLMAVFYFIVLKVKMLLPFDFQYIETARAQKYEWNEHFS